MDPGTDGARGAAEGAGHGALETNGDGAMEAESHRVLALSRAVLVSDVKGERIVWRPATLIARTVEAEPRYDVRLADGAILTNLAGEKLRRV